jgi:hypothetical protein
MLGSMMQTPLLLSSILMHAARSFPDVEIVSRTLDRRATRPPPKPTEVPMPIRSSLLAAAFTFASLGAAHANGLRPIEGQSINLGDVSGVAYYTVEPDGFRVVTTLAQGEAGTPIRFVTVLVPGQRVVVSTPYQAPALEISRKGDELLVRKVSTFSN